MQSFTEEQKKRARKVDLYGFLMRYYPDRYMKEGVSIRPKDNHSISIRRGYSGYLDLSTGEKGNSLDYLVRHLGYSVKDAVFALCGDDTPVALPVKRTKRKAGPIFPEPETGPWKRLYAYLLHRGIPQGVIDELVRGKLLYQTKEHGNMVFANLERDWGELRGTCTYADTRCRRQDGCEAFCLADHGWCSRMYDCPRYKKSSFHGVVRDSREDGFWWIRTAKDADVAYVCEGAIDAISLMLLQRRDGSKAPAYYISIGGVEKRPAIDRLLKQIHVILAVDHDAAGQACRDVYPELESILPVRKDWNEDWISVEC